MNTKERTIVVFHWPNGNGDGVTFPDGEDPKEGTEESDPSWRKLTELFGETWQLFGYRKVESAGRESEWLKVNLFHPSDGGMPRWKETVIVFIGEEGSLFHWLNYPIQKITYRQSFVSATAVEVYNSTQPMGSAVGGVVPPEGVTRH